MDLFAPVQWLADRVVYDLLNILPQSSLGKSLDFFIYDTIKILVLLSVIIFVISFIRTYLPPEKTKKYLSHQKFPLLNNFLAALVGIVTPFCSCSAVPLFIGFVEAGVPLGATFSCLLYTSDAADE